jgi:hypothetical protein
MLEELQASLLQRVRTHRLTAAPLGGRSGFIPELNRVIEENSRWLGETVDRYGWPDSDVVGKDGAHAAWFLAQHADQHPEVQRRCLALLQVAVSAGKAERRDLAMLSDRVRVNSGDPQLFGTHWRYDGADWVPMAAIVEPEDVDSRRRAMGLDSRAENRERMRRHR